MANELYNRAREGFLVGDISWRDSTINAVLVKSSYVFNINDRFYTAIETHHENCIPEEITGKSWVNGIADGNDIIYSGIASGNDYNAIVIYQDTGNVATSRLIAYIDQAGLTLPVSATGADISIVWSNDANRIFRI